MSHSCIIFICTFDPFGYGYSRYVVKQVIEDHPELCYNDGTMKVFLSTKAGLKGTMSTELRALLDYVNGAEPSGTLSKKIDAAVKTGRTQQNWRREYMMMEDGRAEREDQLRTLYLAMKKAGCQEAFDLAMESDDRSLLNNLLEEYGITS